jgi:hypothetical protein
MRSAPNFAGLPDKWTRRLIKQLFSPIHVSNVVCDSGIAA